MVVEAADGTTPFNLPLSLVLGKMPQKEFHLTSPAAAAAPPLLPLRPSPPAPLQQPLPSRFTVDSCVQSCAADAATATPSLPTAVASALHNVLRLLDVGSKRFLANKVDRSVTGLVAQQLCVGPLHTPLADAAVLAQSHFSTTGVALAVGECRMCVQ